MSRSHRTRPVLAVIAAVALAMTTMVVAGTASADNIGTDEGCTPGYWKNHTESWEEYGPDLTVAELFPLPASLASLGPMTLEEALGGGGGRGELGGARILLRAAVASFLNAAHEGIGYPYRRYDEPGNIGPRITAALASGDRAAMVALAAELDDANNLGCPLGNGTPTTTTSTSTSTSTTTTTTTTTTIPDD